MGLEQEPRGQAKGREVGKVVQFSPCRARRKRDVVSLPSKARICPQSLAEDRGLSFHSSKMTFKPHLRQGNGTQLQASFGLKEVARCSLDSSHGLLGRTEASPILPWLGDVLFHGFPLGASL